MKLRNGKTIDEIENHPNYRHWRTMYEILDIPFKAKYYSYYCNPVSGEILDRNIDLGTSLDSVCQNKI